MRCWLIGVLLMLLVPATAGAQQESSRNEAASSPDAVAVHAALAKVAPSLVRIHVVSIEHEDAYMSVEEGLLRAIEFLNDAIIFEQPATPWWT